MVRENTCFCTSLENAATEEGSSSKDRRADITGRGRQRGTGGAAVLMSLASKKIGSRRQSFIFIPAE